MTDPIGRTATEARISPAMDAAYGAYIRHTQGCAACSIDDMACTRGDLLRAAYQAAQAEARQ